MKVVKINGIEIYLNQVEYTIKNKDCYTIEIPISYNPTSKKKHEGLDIDEMIVVIRDILKAINTHCNYFDYAIAMHHLEIAALHIKKKNHDKATLALELGLNKPTV